MGLPLNAPVCAEIQRRLNVDDRFEFAADWVFYTIGISVGNQHAWFKIARGKIEEFGIGLADNPRVHMVGDDAAWAKLADPERNGGVYRSYRTKEIMFEGDLIEALQRLKVLWWLTECLADIWKEERVN